MGLDVDLYQFKGVDTDPILKLSQFSEEPWAYEEYHKWENMPPSERGNFPSAESNAASRQKLLAKAKELGLQEKIIENDNYGGMKISFPSQHHPRWPIGEWFNLSTTCWVIEHFTGRDLYFVFPEAKDVHAFLRPDWPVATKRLKDILEQLKRVEPRRYEEVFGVPEWFGDSLDQIEVMIETLDFVLNSGASHEFLLYWSA